MPQVRAAALTNFEQVARFVGVDPVPLLKAAGLAPGDLDDPERRLPLSTVAELLEEAACRSGCAQFGLLMAESRSLASLGPLSLLLKHQVRVGDVIEAMVRHQRLFGSVHIDRDPTKDLMIVRVSLPIESRQGIELVAAFFCRCVAAVLERPWSPESVQFAHKAPDDLRVHRRVFGCPIDFEREYAAIVCTREALREEPPASDSELASHAERLLALIAPAPDLSTSERVRRSLRLILPEQKSAIEDVASNLCRSPRTVQRQLDREGVGYGALLNDVRRELAQKYLATSHQIGAIAAMTGFRRASSFSRWFTGQFGMSPIEYREQKRRAPAAGGGRA